MTLVINRSNAPLFVWQVHVLSTADFRWSDWEAWVREQYGDEAEWRLPGNRRNYLTKAAAVRKLKLLERFGIVAVVLKSNPVTFFEESDQVGESE